MAKIQLIENGMGEIAIIKKVGWFTLYRYTSFNEWNILSLWYPPHLREHIEDKFDELQEPIPRQQKNQTKVLKERTI